MSDRPTAGTDGGTDTNRHRRGDRVNALVLLPDRKELGGDSGTGRPTVSPEIRLAEAVGLAEAIFVRVVDALVVRQATPRPATLIGAGSVAQIADTVRDGEIDLVVVDATLTPVQQRNLERAWKAKVIDRTGLILEIFGERARTAEGQLQVELAHLSYQRSRLVRSWTHLERQRGGAGFLGGPGESQIELDRRLIDDRIAQIRRQLAQVRRTRGLHRQARGKVPFPVVALVGYTNAGKSTLFNRLTQAEVVARDMLFATLDPTMRLVDLDHGRQAILSDTVGFIADLPTALVAAFRATLEEVQSADLIIHVRDIAHPATLAQKADVESVLDGLGVDATDRTRVVEVWNKLDQLDDAARERVRAGAAASPDVVAISAWTGEGIDDLKAALAGFLNRSRAVVSVALSPADGSTLAWLYRHGEVLCRDDGAAALTVTVRLEPADIGRLTDRLGAERVRPAPLSPVAAGQFVAQDAR